MKKVEACFKLSFTEEELLHAKQYVEDMKRHPKRIYWVGKKEKSDEELVYSHIAHRILSGYYNSYNPLVAARKIIDMKSKAKEV